MRRRLVVLTEIISPYRIPLFNELAQRPEVDLHVIFLAETDPGLRQWHVYKEEIRFSYTVLPSWRMNFAGRGLLLNRGLARALRHANPEAILCGGYNYVASWQALLWARTHNVPLLLWSESHAHESRRPRALIEFVKDEFLQRCAGFVVPGAMARDYLLGRGCRADTIFTAPNAVDNALFSGTAAGAIRNETELRRELSLPRNYFLFVGRLVQEKGVFELLHAYAKLGDSQRQEFGLVFAGDGACRAALESEAARVSPGSIRFAGFVHREQLAVYYALAEFLILPTYSDTWGLVVNEGMACGLPVIVTTAAGCAGELVKDDWNGFVIPPKDADALAAALRRLASEPGLRSTMARNSAQQISRFSAAAWCEGIAEALAGTVGLHD